VMAAGSSSTQLGSTTSPGASTANSAETCGTAGRPRHTAQRLEAHRAAASPANTSTALSSAAAWRHSRTPVHTPPLHCQVSLLQWAALTRTSHTVHTTAAASSAAACFQLQLAGRSSSLRLKLEVQGCIKHCT